ncbi:MAG: bifunctional alpha,alpha-trehalose-phosphate synthase (UDP-forming)/trehalose-phosphatase [Phycisphaerae bacterium]|nr:bifunctional alpha,alpha-trehalose-phosphate synthase (UDP-forming)/trehalose-phosphatase [Phycisphaerae bacterium]
MKRKTKVITVSNRLPVTLGKEIKKSSGGLVSAMEGTGGEFEMSWIGWPGSAVVDAKRRQRVQKELRESYGFEPIFLTQEEVTGYYQGFSNSSLWPLLHYRMNFMRYESEWWDCYRQVNSRFAEAVLADAREGDLVWIHDYHLMLLPQMLRKAGRGLRIGLFLHTPFPSYEVYRCHPNRRELLEGLLGADLVGFHTFGYLRHFRSSVIRLLNAEAHPDHIAYNNHKCVMGVYPIGCNATAFKEELHTPGFSRRRSYFERIYEGKKLVLSVERLDYSKGIPQKLDAIEKFLETWEHASKVTFVFISVPSRGDVPEYQQLRQEVETRVGHINGRFSTVDNVPIHFIHKSISFTDLCALYSLADVAMVTPFVDGMNLVAKEYAACKPDGTGALVLSEFAGATDELFKAIIVNPYDLQNMISGLRDALTIPADDKHRRMSSMHERVITFDNRYWAHSFVTDLSHVTPETSRRRRPDQTEQQVLAKTAQAGRIAFFLDYDGTLKELQDDADTAWPTAPIQDLLDRLAQREHVDTYIISGRKPDDLDSWLGHYPFTLIAEHGFLYRLKGHKHWQPLDAHADLSWKSQVIDVLGKFVGSTPGSYVEEKASSVVWHFRRSDPEFGQVKAQQLIGLLQDMLSNVPVRVHHGKKIVEISSLQVSKGAAMSYFTQNRRYDVIVCAGDDQTDESMFRLEDERLIKIKVGREETLADIRMDNPADFRNFIASMVNVIGTSR